MVCLPCIVIPLLLWVFHKFIQPFILKFWNPSSLNGTKSITEGPPPEGVSATDKEYLYIQQAARSNPVLMFSKTTCSFSKMAKDVLDEVGVSYTVDEIDGRDDCGRLQDMFQKLTGQRTVPRVFIGGKCVGGGSDVWTLHNQKKLVPMLKEAGATFSDKKTD